MLVPKMRTGLQGYNIPFALILWLLTGDFMCRDVGNEYIITLINYPFPQVIISYSYQLLVSDE